ncbi:MAG: hypothetical protein E6H57_02810 [Betaproteobacteria bacterium]|nr:MAG: hypothetical protein E6H57_02810 [Betaproteobacteria bacterium]
MWSTKFAAAALAIIGFVLITACSREDGEASLVPEARADAPNAKDFGWRANPDFSAKQQDDVREYH